MNSVQNSDSEQCTESKLGWVHQVHTLTQAVRTGRAHCTQAVRIARAGRCVMASIGLYRAPPPPPPPPPPGRIVAEPDRVAARTRAQGPCRCAQACRVASLCRAPRSRYKNCIATLAPAARCVTYADARVAAPLRRVTGR